MAVQKLSGVLYCNVLDKRGDACAWIGGFIFQHGARRVPLKNSNDKTIKKSKQY